jgi:hypothetical protein
LAVLSPPISDLTEFRGNTRFQVLRRLGGGGMGVVYEALDHERNTRVALKALRTLDANAVLRFKNEFRWLQDLQHPNLVSLGELFAENDQWYFTMELVDGVDFLSWVRPPEGARAADGLDRAAPPPKGRDEISDIILGAAELAATDPAHVLESRIPRPGPTLHEPRLRDALAQLARGLQALHFAGKVHRDIKPSNVLVDGDARVVLLDFGLAAPAAPDLPGAGGQLSDINVVGTVDYMAPEQAASRPVGPAADWYAVGSVLYEALTGQVPFKGPPLEVLMQKQSRRPPSPRELVPTVPRDLDALTMDLLAIDPAARPTGEVVLRRLGEHAPIELRPPVASPTAPGGARGHGMPAGTATPFVGRGGELGTLHRAFVDSLGNAPVVVFVQGESGVGKSALVRQFVDEVSRAHPGVVVLGGRCYEREAVPYKAFDGVIDALSRYMMRLPRADAEALLPLRASLLAQVFPVLRRVEAVAQTPLVRTQGSSPQEQRARVFGALRELLVRLGERQPVVVVIDDLQWADADSLSLLSELLQPPEAPRLLLIGTVRTAADDASDRERALSLAAASESLEDVRHLELQRLTHDEARELVELLAREAGASAADIDAETIAAEADGHPLFIDELVRHATSGGATGNLRLDEVLWSRIGRLDPPVRGLLELIVAAGTPLVQEVAATAASIDFGEFTRRLGELRAAHLVRTSGARRTDTVEPYHDRVRAALTARLDPHHKRRLHERLALALEASGRADPELLSIHWRGAGDTERAAHYAATAAAQAAEALAFERSARLYRLAIELRPIEAAAYQARLGAVLATAGRGGDAALAFLEASKGARPEDSSDLVRRAAEQLLLSGRIDEGLEAMRPILDEMGLAVPPTPGAALRRTRGLRLRLLVRGSGFRARDATQVPPAQLRKVDVAWTLSTAYALVEPLRAAELQLRHLLLALTAGEPARVMRARLALAVQLAARGRLGEAARLLNDCEKLATSLAMPLAHAQLAIAHGAVAMLTGRLGDAVDRLTAAEQTLREKCVGVTWELDATQMLRLWCLQRLGRLRELAETTPVLLRSALERGDLLASTLLRTGTHLAWLARDEAERAKAESADAVKRWGGTAFTLPHLLDLQTQVEARLYAGEGERALRLYLKREPELRASRLLGLWPVAVLAADLRVRALLATAAGDPPERAALLAEAERLARRLANDARHHARPLGLLALASAAALAQRAPLADERLAEAEQGFLKSGLLLHAAVARSQRGRLLGGDEGRALVASAAAQLQAERVRNPTRLAAMIAPGFPDW